MKITRTSYPNDSHSFVIQPKVGGDERQAIALSCKPHELLAKLRQVVEWLEPKS